MLDFPEFSAIIFDLDGLILDTEPTYFAAWEGALEMMGYADSRVFCHSLTGLSYSAISQKLYDAYGDAFDLARFSRLSSENWRAIVNTDGIAIKPGFDDLMLAIERFNLPYCLATNSMGPKARDCLKLAGLEELFSIILSREQVEFGKPDPAIYLMAAQCLELAPEQCLVLEDSLPGVQAAARAGAKIAYIPSDPIDPEASRLADRQFETLAPLAEIILRKFS